MCGKSNFAKHNAEIESLKRKYGKAEDTIVIMCFDTDKGGTGEEENKIIAKYCVNKNYRLIWFNRDVEEVFIGEEIPSKDKNRAAQEFLRKSHIKNIDWDSPLFKKVTIQHGTSNVIFVLDSLFKKKAKSD